MANYFSLILVALTLITGLIWLVDSLVFAPKRKARLQAAATAEGAGYGEDPQLPYLVDTSQQIFPVIAFNFLLYFIKMSLFGIQCKRQVL